MNNKNTELIRRYESMLQGGATCYFDIDEFSEIAFEYEITERPEKALQAIEWGLHFHPTSEELLSRRAYYLLMLDRVAEAKEVMENVHIETEESMSVRAELSLLDGDRGGAVMIISKMLLNDEITVDTCLSVADLCSEYGLFDILLPNLLNAALAISPESRIQLLRELVNMLDDIGENMGQPKVYEKILDLKPYSAQDWICAAKAYVDAGNTEMALESIDFAITINPSDPVPLFFKSYCFYENGDFSMAADLITEILPKMSDRETPYSLLAECYTNLGRYADSDKILNIAVKEFPNNSRYLFLKAKNAYLGSYNMAKSIRLLKKALQKDPEDTDISLFIAEIYLEQENYTEARKILSRLEDVSPEDTRISLLLGDVELKCGFPDLAVGYYKKVFANNKYNVDICFKLIFAYSELNDVKNMKSVIRRVERIISDKKLLENEMSDGAKADIEHIRLTINKLKDILRDNIDDKIK